MSREFLALGLLALCACEGTVYAPRSDFDLDGSGSTPADERDDQAPVADEPGTVADPLAVTPSRTQRVRFKGGERWLTDLSVGLDLDPNAVCVELGDAPCLELHGITLGGVEPYGKRIDTPVEGVPVTAPIAVERIAWLMCGARVDRDFAGEGGLFSELAGAPAPLDALPATTDALYRALVQREPDPGERDALVALFDEIQTEPRATSWSKAACFAVATSLEALFY